MCEPRGGLAEVYVKKTLKGLIQPPMASDHTKVSALHFGQGVSIVCGEYGRGKSRIRIGKFN